MDLSWREASSYLQENEGRSDLIGKRVRIYWDGDKVFYEADVTGFDNDSHTVVYTGDSEVYTEKLLQPDRQTWQIYVGSKSHTFGVPADSACQSLPSKGRKNEKEKAMKRGSGYSYTEMILLAMQKSGDINQEISLVALRKKISKDFPETLQKAKASFNNLTTKATTKLIAEGKLERVKNSYRFTDSYVKELVNANREAVLREGGEEGLQGELLKEFALKSEVGLGVFDHDTEVRNELVLSRAKRNAFLRKKRHLLEPFMPKGENFLTKLDRELKAGTEAVKNSLIQSNRKEKKDDLGPKSKCEGFSTVQDLDSHYRTQEMKLKQQHILQQQQLIRQQRQLQQQAVR